MNKRDKKSRPFVVFALSAGALSLMLILLWQYENQDQTVARLFPHDDKIVETGQVIYAEHCASCHGTELEGQSNWKRRKPNGRMPAPPHDATGHTWHHPDDALFRTTKFGPTALAGGTYKSDMPAYEGLLRDQEIIEVLSYIKSTWPDEIRIRHDKMNKRLEE